jgi:2-methylcitrate dehydratase PrpD
VHITENPAMTALVPKLRPAKVTVTLADGRSATVARDSHRGDFSEPFSEDELRAKFRELAGVVLLPQGVAAVERAVDDIEEWPDIGDLIGLLRRYGRG